MKDGFDVVTDVRSLVNVADITKELTGQVWSDARPNNRMNKSDIVINSGGLTNDWQQEGSANVNIYWPNLSSTNDGIVSSMPDQYNLKRMANKVVPLLETQFRVTFRTTVEDPPVIVKDTDGSYFASIKVNYISMQTNFKNI